MELARLSPQIEPGLAVIVEDWDKLHPTRRKQINIEELCAAHDVDPIHFISIVAEAAMRFKDNATLMISSMHSPALLEKSIQFGMKKDGWKDRQAVLQGAGVFPSPQGTRISILNQNSAKAAAAAEVNVERGLPTFERSIADMEDQD
jgi:hypothetical protein